MDVGWVGYAGYKALVLPMLMVLVISLIPDCVMDRFMALISLFSWAVTITTYLLHIGCWQYPQTQTARRRGLLLACHWRYISDRTTLLLLLYQVAFYIDNG
jgi:hypothetical protein